MTPILIFSSRTLNCTLYCKQISRASSICICSTTFCSCSKYIANHVTSTSKISVNNKRCIPPTVGFHVELRPGVVAVALRKFLDHPLHPSCLSMFYINTTHNKIYKRNISLSNFSISKNIVTLTKWFQLTALEAFRPICALHQWPYSIGQL